MKQLKLFAFLLFFLLMAGCATDDRPSQSVEITFEATIASTVTETAETPAPTVEMTATPTSTMPASTPTAAIASETPSQTSPDTVIPVSCGPPTTWITYPIRAGDTLFSLARKTGVNVEQIMQANCLSNNLIFAGQLLYLPFIPATPTVPTVPASTSTIEVPSPPSETPPSTNTATVEVPTAPSPGDPELIIKPFSGPVGTVHTITIQEFKPGEQVTLQVVFFTTQEVVFSFSTTVDDKGNDQVQITTTSNYATGIYRVVGQGNMGTVADELFEVTP